MKEQKGKATVTLRQRAEEQLSKREKGESVISGPDQLNLVHELQVHQIELEMQNEELRRSQQEADEQRRRYQDLYDFAPVGFLSMDSAGMVTEANLTAATLLGCDRHRVVGHPLYIFFAPESRGEYYAFLRRLATGGTADRCEVLLGASTKRQGWLLLNGGTFVANGGSLRLALTDITDRKSAEEALQREKGFVDSVINSMPGIFYVFDNQERLLRWNRRFEEFSGHSSQEMSTMRPHDFVAEEDHGLMEAKLREVLVEGRSAEAELLLLDRKELKIPYHCTGSPMTVGNAIYLIGLGVDISERVRAEAALRKSERKFLKVFHAVPALVAITTLTEGRFIDVNEAYEQILGYRREELVGRTSLELGIWKSQADRDRIIRTLEEHGKVRDLEVTFRGKNGQVFTGLFSAEYIHFNGNRDMLSLLNDITDRKRMEQEIEQLNTNLAARAAELESANLELEAFNYTVAHDLRKPLSVINSYCQVIKELCGDKLDQQCLEYLRESYEGTLRMNSLIDALLNFSRISRMEPGRKKVDLSALAKELIGEIKLAEPRRRATFQISEGITVEGDPKLLRLALDNLLGNAWKYTGGREEAVIQLGVAEIHGEPACFVRDNGDGFDMAFAEKLFRPFQRLPGAEKFRGNGIGLATVERIIKHHGGRIWAEGEPEKGATFWFTLPTPA